MKAPRASKSGTPQSRLVTALLIPTALFLMLLLVFYFLISIPLEIMLIMLVAFFIAELIYLESRGYNISLFLLVNAPIYIIFGYLLLFYAFLPVFRDAITNMPSMIEGFLSLYYLQKCCGISHSFVYIINEGLGYLIRPINMTSLNKYLQQCGVPAGNITMLVDQAVAPLFTISKLAQIKYGFPMLIIIVLPLLALPFSDILYRRILYLRSGLCVGDMRLLVFHSLRLFFTYFVAFWLILYFLLLFFIDSEYLSVYLLLIITFLLIIAEAFIGKGITSSTHVASILLLSASVIALGAFASLVFYLSGFILPNMCMVPLTLLTFQGLASTYASLLPIAAACGAVPYASTLLLLHYRLICGLGE
jgi:hypothetical protein